ncbi:prepilin-type N-terminal cleavage/methylation domain-containing protein [Gimibacter soli]|uniref:Prepilin-type N-terminal cleavage/methylation domain-containing protein n=1 Tax=Gimibacter soli TaxID=3024400 RepID=A0AAE9XML3_9PROT|nr:prepilin-type N-terminal cleavage/methylation domain-containing protein [Gimibacter soli]WCL53738.1 prepilin-type N-terminal cleavage/methylation domain-containing protein [Gimibacter soli]
MGGRRASSDAGFTLVEVMVTVALMALASAAVVLTLPRLNPSPEATAEATRDRLADIAARAVIGGEIMGVEVDHDGLTPLYRRDGRWVEAGPRWIAEGAGLALEGIPAEKGEDGTPRLPDLWFTPAGDARSFRLRIERDGDTVLLTGDEQGQMRLTGEKP